MCAQHITEIFVYWQLQSRLNTLFTITSFSVLHRSFERGKQGYKFKNLKLIRVHMFMLTTTGNFSYLPSAFSLCGAMTAEQLQCMPSTQLRVSPPDVFRELLNQASCWQPGPFPLWQQHCPLQEESAAPWLLPSPPLWGEGVQLFFRVKPWLAVQRTGSKHFCQQKTELCTLCSMVKLFRLG